MEKKDKKKDGTLTLKNPIQINGETVTEMRYDINEIDGVLFATASKKNVSISAAAEFDFGLHLYLGYAAIIAVNPSYDFSDMERIKGHDVVEVMQIGRNFMLASDKASPESDSDEHTETTPECTTPAPQTSKKSQS